MAYEDEWNELKVKILTPWRNAYPDSSFEVISKDNFENWLDRWEAVEVYND